jgi:hypothetical protein
MSHIYHRALFIKKTLGTRRAAGFLRNKGVPLNIAVKVLAKTA